MNLECLQTFLVLAQCRNFTRASEMLYVAQSTISNRIRVLEEYTKCQLVIRNKSGVELTAEGKLFLQYVRQILDIGKAAFQEMQLMKTYQDQLNVGCVQWIHDCWLSDSMVQYSREYPDIAVNLTVDHGEKLVSLMHSQLLDLVVSSHNVNTNDLISCPYQRVKIVLVGESSSFAALKKGIRWDELQHIPLIYADVWPNFLADISEHLFLDEQIYPVRCNMLGSAKNYCMAGVACCFLPWDLVKKELEEGKLIEIPIRDTTPHYMNLYITYDKKRLLSPALQNFCRLFPEAAPDYKDF